MALKEEINGIIGKQRRFLLLRIIGVDPRTARSLCNVTPGIYNNWVNNPEFSVLYHKVEEYRKDYRDEAMLLLRRANQLRAVLLEEEIIDKMRLELESGEYKLLKTHLAREVYSKLINDLDYQPQTQNLTWAQRIDMLNYNPPHELKQGEVIDAEYETDNSKAEQYPESIPVPEDEQAGNETPEKT